MRATSYHFSHQGVVAAPRARVHEVLLDLFHYVDWWPQVRAVASLGPDDALLVCRSVLPYDLEVRLHAVSRDAHRLEVAVDGPFTGWVRWSLDEVRDGAGPTCTRLGFEQQVQVARRSLVVGTYVARPLLVANHRWMMRGAERGLQRRCQPSAATAAS
ncbi:MAG TPA: polyketide cyclase [Marmoricola sp.]|nr:polyketide cyclase [Marmoricola sp.]